MSVVIPSLRGAIAVPGWAKNELWRRALAVPSLDLRFADNKSLVDAVTGASLITFTRASNGTFVGSDGVLQTATNDVPRFDHNPTTGESLGLLVEEQRTNSITNNTMVGAVAGTPGTNPTSWLYATAQSNGLTLSIVGTGVENGINYIDYRFNGTTVASPNACAIGIVNASAATAQTWTASTYWKLAAGSTTGTANWQLGLIENTAGGVFVTGALYSQTAPTSAALNTQRPAATRTLSGGATVGLVTFPINVAVTGNTAIDFTIRIGLPQLEQGAFTTSPILTSGAAATRNADVVSITGSAFTSFYNQTEGSFFCSTFAPKGTIIYGTGDTFNNTQYISAALTYNVFIRSGGASSATLTAPVSAATVTNIAHGYAANNFAAVSNGGTIDTDISGAVPLAQVRLKLGSTAWDSGGNNNINGHIRRLTYWPQRLANSTLQAITQ
jgi:hypothetical protein